jgi:choloylglycine hydrolase
MCTGLLLRCEDGAVVVGRTLEFARAVGALPTVMDGVVGMAAGGFFVDGCNAEGLACLAFYFRCYADYAERPEPGRVNVPPHALASHLLRRASCADDVERALSEVTVVAAPFAPWGAVLPLHWMVADRSGRCLVLECSKGRVRSYDNPLGVFANAPPWPEQLRGLQAYEALSPRGPPGACSLGGGFAGLPGDFTSPSRLARAAVFARFARRPATASAGVAALFRVLGSFHIEAGWVLERREAEVTQYVAAYDLRGSRGWLRTYQDLDVRPMQAPPSLVPALLFGLAMFLLILCAAVAPRHRAL